MSVVSLVDGRHISRKSEYAFSAGVYAGHAPGFVNLGADVN